MRAGEGREVKGRREEEGSERDACEKRGVEERERVSSFCRRERRTRRMNRRKREHSRRKRKER